ncbi:hypothetical protein [Aurantiacibacter flavus]|uniref:Major facilitator superfamily (MFS) profile domain-containing protein n=1 Tax=Aurantiacibacter flavus TaxID=3145232 RepID=A0ABV0D0D8_9SPHN
MAWARGTSHEIAERGPKTAFARPTFHSHLDRRIGGVMASTVGNAVSLSPVFLSVFGVAMVPIAEEFSWPRSLVAGAMALSILKSLALALGTGAGSVMLPILAGLFPSPRTPMNNGAG